MARGFAIKTQGATGVPAGNYTVPAAFRTIVATVNPGNPGNPGNPSPNTGYGQTAPTPGNPGNPSTFNGGATTTYLRSASTLAPRKIVAVTLGNGGNGGNGGGTIGYSGTGNPGNPGNPGSVTVQVT